MRDDRDDGNAISGVFHALPLALILWGLIALIVIGIVRLT